MIRERGRIGMCGVRSLFWFVEWRGSGGLAGDVMLKHRASRNVGGMTALVASVLVDTSDVAD